MRAWKVLSCFGFGALSLGACLISPKDYPLGDFGGASSGGKAGKSSGGGSTAGGKTNLGGKTSSGGDEGQAGEPQAGSGANAGKAQGGSGAGGTGGTGGSSNPGGELLISDGAADQVYRLDLEGNVLATLPSPVTGTRGVTYDRRNKDGFWVCGQSNPASLYKVAWSGEVMIQLSLENAPNEVLGLDYLLAAPDDELVLQNMNSNNLETIQVHRASNGKMLLSTGHVVQLEFLSGSWGVRAISRGPNPLDHWVSRADGTLQRFANADRTATVTTKVGSMRGLDMAPDSTFWVVAGAQVAHLDAAGNVLTSFGAPSNDPMGLSYSE